MLGLASPQSARLLVLLLQTFLNFSYVEDIRAINDSRKEIKICCDMHMVGYVQGKSEMGSGRVYVCDTADFGPREISQVTCNPGPDNWVG